MSTPAAAKAASAKLVLLESGTIAPVGSTGEVQVEVSQHSESCTLGVSDVLSSNTKSTDKLALSGHVTEAGRWCEVEESEASPTNVKVHVNGTATLALNMFWLEEGYDNASCPVDASVVHGEFTPGGELRITGEFEKKLHGGMYCTVTAAFKFEAVVLGHNGLPLTTELVG